jgi:hypothetical protein
MSIEPPNSPLRAFFASVYGKLVAALVIIALLLGIALEYVQLRGAVAELPAKTGKVREPQVPPPPEDPLHKLRQR